MNKGRISLERAFMTVSKRLLKEETYKMLLEEAKFVIEEFESEKEKYLKEKKIIDPEEENFNK